MRRILSSVSVDLFFQAVASQVFSALQSLTSVFGMGTGGPFALKTLTMVHLQGFDPETQCNTRTPCEIKSLTRAPFTAHHFFSLVHLQGFEPGTH